MEITGYEYRIARANYYRMLGPWTTEYPTFEHFISPANGVTFRNPSDTSYYKLNVAEAKRWAIIQSPHVEALLKAWLIQQDRPLNAAWK